MLYKTMVLELLRQQPELYDRLRKHRMLLPALEFYARGLKASHEARKTLLAQARPGSDPGQTASEALEQALEELQASLAQESSTDAGEALSLDEVMAFLRRHTPPG